jgi:hypothetical protein
MKIVERKEILDELNAFFEVTAEEFESSYTWTIVNKNFQDFIVISISSEISSNAPHEDMIINVQSSQGVFEIHGCENYMILPPDEVFFWKEDSESISCLIISKQATCSLYSNISKKLLSKDITDLSPSQILASVQISMISTQ